MKYFILSVLLLISSFTQADEAERKHIERTLQLYIDGSSYNQVGKITQAFAPNAELLLEKKDQEIWPVTIQQYLYWFSKNPNTFNGRVGEILNVDIEGRIATAKVEIHMPSQSKRFVDMFLLKKLSSGWKIVSKSAIGEDTQTEGERILFIVSDAHFHGDSSYPAGVSFSELANAYSVFKQNGFTVDFVSPQGGAIPLSYINTSNPKHKAFIYDSDFMYAIKHTKTPAQIEPSRYRAVHYIGGSNAMYGIHDNKQIQGITMAIYEDFNGIVSSVCHGTAGLANLKTKDGKFLVTGKRITGYPKVFENHSREYIKKFPFFIDEKITSRGGVFNYSEPDEAYIEVDGRIVTGQNYQSSAPVAEQMVQMLKQSKTSISLQ